MTDSKKLLRLGSDHPRCARCKTDDVRLLCRVRGAPAKGAVLCRNCHARGKPLSPAAAARKARAFAAAGYTRPECVICAEAALQLLERDHLAGAANSERTQPLCANHHAIKSYMAEHGDMAPLRLRDPQRSALLLQAAFELGLGAMLALFAAWDGVHGETARCIFLGTSSVLLLAWAAWNISADGHFKSVLGPDYDRAIPALVPV